MIIGIDHSHKLGPEDFLAVSLDHEKPSILSFKRVNDNKVQIFIGGKYYKTVDTKEPIKEGVAQLAVSDLTQALKEADTRYNSPLTQELQGIPMEFYLYLDSYKGLPESLQRDLITKELISLVGRKGRPMFFAVKKNPPGSFF